MCSCSVLLCVVSVVGVCCCVCCVDVERFGLHCVVLVCGVRFAVVVCVV